MDVLFMTLGPHASVPPKKEVRQVDLPEEALRSAADWRAVLRRALVQYPNVVSINRLASSELGCDIVVTLRDAPPAPPGGPRPARRPRRTP